MARKRVILANGPRLLREMLHRVINKADRLEVVQEIPNHEELPSAIERFDPEWVIISLPYDNSLHGWIDTCMAEYPSVRFIFLSPDNNGIKLKWQTSLRASGQAYEEDLANLSLKDLLHILEKDLQHT